MTDQQKAAEIAAALFIEKRDCKEVIQTLYECETFNHYKFYEAGGFIYMEDDDGRFPAVKVCADISRKIYYE